MRRFSMAWLAPASIFIAGATSAQDVSDAVVKQLVNDTAQAVSEMYLYPEKRPAIVERLRKAEASGRYRVKDRTALAAAITDDLQAITHDLHMSVKYKPDALAMMKGGAAGPGGPGPGGQAVMLEEARTNNQGIVDLRVLPGNVRYMKLNRFFWVPGKTAAAFDRAVEFLNEGDAVIIDISETGGGSPAGVRYLVSHFMDPNVKLMTYLSSVEGNSESRTEKVPARLKQPFVLIAGPRSASAAEEFAAHVKNFKLGPIVGEKTAGAGNRNVMMMTQDGFQISISVATALHAVTNRGWEGNGIEPDVPSTKADALRTAHVTALQAVRETAAGSKTATLDKLIAEVKSGAKGF